MDLTGVGDDSKTKEKPTVLFLAAKLASMGLFVGIPSSGERYSIHQCNKEKLLGNVDEKIEVKQLIVTV